MFSLETLFSQVPFHPTSAWSPLWSRDQRPQHLSLQRENIHTYFNVTLVGSVGGTVTKDFDKKNITKNGHTEHLQISALVSCHLAPVH